MTNLLFQSWKNPCKTAHASRPLLHSTRCTTTHAVVAPTPEDPEFGGQGVDVNVRFQSHHPQPSAALRPHCPLAPSRPGPRAGHVCTQGQLSRAGSPSPSVSLVSASPVGNSPQSHHWGCRQPPSDTGMKTGANQPQRAAGQLSTPCRSPPGSHAHSPDTQALGRHVPQRTSMQPVWAEP